MLNFLKVQYFHKKFLLFLIEWKKKLWIIFKNFFKKVLIFHALKPLVSPTIVLS